MKREGRKFQAVLFDLDDTLLDTLGDIADSMNAALDRMGFPGHPREAYRGFVGEGIERLAEYVLPPRARKAGTIRRVATLLMEEYGGRWAATTRPFPGVAEMLDGLTARGLPLAVLSNKPDDFTRLTVERLLDGWRFHPVLGARPRIAKKPDPAAALEIARTLGLPARSILYLGDSAVDMLTARGAGMWAVGALWGFRSEAELRMAGAETLIAEPLELMGLV